jgi:GNAT superfamily N-acetyltransferase
VRLGSVTPGPGVRRGRPADAVTLARLRYEFRAALDPAAETPVAFVDRCAEWMRRQLERDGPWYCWIAELGHATVGTIWLELIEKLPNPVAERERHAYITNLYVRLAHRGGGAGTLLLRSALAECDARAVDAVLLWPTLRSRSLYQRHAFAPAADLLERRLSPSLPHPPPRPAEPV